MGQRHSSHAQSQATYACVAVRLRIKAVALLLTIVAGCLSPGALGEVAHERLAVTVPRLLNPAGLVTVGIRPRGHLPKGGYYYAVTLVRAERLVGVLGDQPPAAIPLDGFAEFG